MPPSLSLKSDPGFALIIALGKSLNLKVIAEGIETEVQQNVLKQYDCDEVQGFLYSRPVPAGEHESLF